MHTFTDSTGRQWVISLTVSKLKKIKATLDIDLFNACANNIIGELATDIERAIDVIAAACEEQIKERNITYCEFIDLLSGDVIDDAVVAFLDDLVDFFPSAQRQMIQSTLGAQRATMEEVARMVVEKMNDPKTKQKAIENVARQMVDQ